VQKAATIEVMTDAAPTTRPVAILIRGLPGSGKSYLAAALQQALGPDSVVMLDPDATDYQSPTYKDHVQAQTAEGVDPKLHAYRFLREQAYRGIRDHKIIIWNQPFTNLEIFQKMTDRLQEHAAENNTSLPILVIEVVADPAVAKERVEARKRVGGHGPSDATFARFVSEYTTASPLGYTTLPVDGEADVAASIASILQTLENSTP
jgi:predicted ABC-type ATPase